MNNDATTSLESPASEHCSFYTAYSLSHYVETPTDSDSLRSSNMCNFRRPLGSSITLASLPDSPTASSENLESRTSTMRVMPQQSKTSMGIDSQTFGSQHDLQNLTERSPRIIAVMGPTGAGKSTFVKTATGVDDVRIGHRLVSCTDEVRAVRCRHPSQDGDIVLVDTPGFDDTYKSDAQILERIADWLKDTYQAGVRLSGILYLHRITDNRVTNTIIRNLDMFQKLCGSDALSSIVFVTTNWDTLQAKNLPEGEANEGQLRNLYWKELLDAGSKMLRFDNTYSSAWNIIDSVPENAISLKIQREMVDEGKSLHDTTAGRTLSSWLQRASEIFHNIIQRLERLLKGVVDSPDRPSAESKRYKDDLREATEVLRVVNKQERRLSRSASVASSVARRLKPRKKKTLQFEGPDDPRSSDELAVGLTRL